MCYPVHGSKQNGPTWPGFIQEEDETGASPIPPLPPRSKNSYTNLSANGSDSNVARSKGYRDETAPSLPPR